jgi:hypothetical protein
MEGKRKKTENRVKDTLVHSNMRKNNNNISNKIEMLNTNHKYGNNGLSVDSSGPRSCV